MPNELAFLTLVVALSAYLASVRLAVINRLGADPAPKHPEKLRWFLVSLIPADAPLVFSGLLLTADLFWKYLFGIEPAVCLYTGAVWLFVMTVCYLALHHMAAWRLYPTHPAPL